MKRRCGTLTCFGLIRAGCFVLKPLALIWEGRSGRGATFGINYHILQQSCGLLLLHPPRIQTFIELMCGNLTLQKSLKLLYNKFASNPAAVCQQKRHRGRSSELTIGWNDSRTFFFHTGKQDLNSFKCWASQMCQNWGYVTNSKVLIDYLDWLHCGCKGRQPVLVLHERLQ